MYHDYCCKDTKQIVLLKFADAFLALMGADAAPVKVSKNIFSLIVLNILEPFLIV